MINLNLRAPSMKTKTISIQFEKGRAEAYYAMIDGRFIVPLDKPIREDFVNQLRAQGHKVHILPDVRMVATARPEKRDTALTREQRRTLACLLSGESDVDTTPLEDLFDKKASETAA